MSSSLCVTALFSPRLWGCFLSPLSLIRPSIVFPTPVGVFLACANTEGASSSFPHACGGVSSLTHIEKADFGFPHACGGVSIAYSCARNAQTFSPRLWGCFLAVAATLFRPLVFPTPVGVFLARDLGGKPSECFPHACGGVSLKGVTDELREEFSPRLWGCFYRSVVPHAQNGVFPTPVGVFLAVAELAGQFLGFPHACGGVSYVGDGFKQAVVFSPRLWGCFFVQREREVGRLVFPTPVGVFPRLATRVYGFNGFPHACGGVSFSWRKSYACPWFSPRLWGCFPFPPATSRNGDVFPTPVGVFLEWQPFLVGMRRFPHACGGVSDLAIGRARSTQFSPRLWGCFSLDALYLSESSVFPTPVGVFLLTI